MSKFSKTFRMSVSIIDAATQICIGYHRTYITCRCSERAKLLGIEEAKHKVLETWVRKMWQQRYGITAKQYTALLADREINPLKHYVFEIDKFKEVAETTNP